MTRFLYPILVLGTVFAGCGIYSRYNPGNKFGDIIEDDKNQLASNLAAGNEGGETQPGADRQFLAWGKELFEDTGLGNNGQACASCHPGGGTTGGEARIPKKMGHGPYVLPIPSLVGASSRFPKYKVPNGRVITLQHMNNNCIRMFMNGKRLPLDSPESVALGMYVTSFSKGEQIEVGGGR